MISLADMMDILNFSANLSGFFHSPKNDNFFPFTCIIIIGLVGIFYGIFQTWRRQRNRKHHQFVTKLKSIAENAEKKAKDETGKKKKKKLKTPTKNDERIKKKTKKANRKIPLQPEIWTDIVQWIPFQELAKSLSLVNGQLQEICAPKIYEENRRVVNPIGIEKKGENDSESDESDSVYDNWDSDDEEDGYSERDEGKKKGKEGGKKKKDGKKEEEILRVQKCVWDSEYSELVEIPLATVPPPPNIIGFRRINIRHLNDQILAFLRLIKPLIESGPNEVCLSIDDRRRCSRTERNRGF